MAKISTSAKLNQAFMFFKKYWVANILNISRPTLNTKLKNDDFSDEEVEILVGRHIIDREGDW